MSRDPSSEPIRPTKLLLVEDDERISSALQYALNQRDYETVVVTTGGEALDAEAADLILLDLGLPDMDGLEVCRRIRETSDVPIIAITARGESAQRVAGLRTGVDDYIVKPFSLAELSARIDAVLRRTGRSDRSTGQPGPVQIGSVTIDQTAHSVSVDGRLVQLTRKEYDLLLLLAERPGTVLSRAEILEEVWHTTWLGKSRTVDVHVAVLRQKLDVPDLIKTVHGVGYQLVKPQ